MLRAALLAITVTCVPVYAYGQDEPKPPETLIPGRYQIVFNPNMRADTFLLDTATGKVWRMTQITDLKTEPDVWMYVWRIDTPSEEGALAVFYGTKEVPPPPP